MCCSYLFSLYSVYTSMVQIRHIAHVPWCILYKLIIFNFYLCHVRIRHINLYFVVRVLLFCFWFLCFYLNFNLLFRQCRGLFILRYAVSIHRQQIKFKSLYVYTVDLTSFATVTALTPYGLHIQPNKLSLVFISSIFIAVHIRFSYFFIISTFFLALIGSLFH